MYDIDNFKSFPDTCNTCSCKNGKVSCTENDCSSDSWTACVHKGKRYENGTTFPDSCNTCKCKEGQVGCTKIFCGSEETPSYSKR